MTTKIEKCKLKSIVIGENTPPEADYTDQTVSTDMDLQTLALMVKTIPKLDKKAHECIYELIRNVKPASFFATNGLGTHFNILNLNNKIKWELHRLCQMSVDDLDRKNVIKTADTHHETILESLDSSLHPV